MPLSIEDEVFGSLGEPLVDDLSVERVREDRGPVLEEAVARDAGRAPVLVALRDDLEGEIGLRRIHRKHGEVVDDEEVGLSLIHISEPTRRTPISYAVFCLKKKK